MNRLVYQVTESVLQIVASTYHYKHCINSVLIWIKPNLNLKYSFRYFPLFLHSFQCISDTTIFLKNYHLSTKNLN
ncbi:hypothetical protein [Methylophilus methylotrophus]|uniref:hypothetical protein n=1 Tax=Methylophilus methylotrophus TaxID=17 RepID=UPI003CCBEEC8